MAKDGGTTKLVDELCSPEACARLYAAKNLPRIDDPVAPDGLVRLLQDEDLAVRWAAMNSLISLERQAILPLLIALTHDYNSINLRSCARHILRQLWEYGELNGFELEVLRALERPGLHAIQIAEIANQASIADMKLSSHYPFKRYPELPC